MRKLKKETWKKWGNCQACKNIETKKFKNGKKSQKRPKITERDKIRLKKNDCESFTKKKQPGNHENCTKCLAKRKNEKRIK